MATPPKEDPSSTKAKKPIEFGGLIADDTPAPLEKSPKQKATASPPSFAADDKLNKAYLDFLKEQLRNALADAGDDAAKKDELNDAHTEKLNKLKDGVMSFDSQADAEKFFGEQARAQNAPMVAMQVGADKKPTGAFVFAAQDGQAVSCNPGKAEGKAIGDMLSKNANLIKGDPELQSDILAKITQFNSIDKPSEEDKKAFMKDLTASFDAANERKAQASATLGDRGPAPLTLTDKTPKEQFDERIKQAKEALDFAESNSHNSEDALRVLSRANEHLQAAAVIASTPGFDGKLMSATDTEPLREQESRLQQLSEQLTASEVAATSPTPREIVMPLEQGASDRLESLLSPLPTSATLSAGSDSRSETSTTDKAVNPEAEDICRKLNAEYETVEQMAPHFSPQMREIMFRDPSNLSISFQVNPESGGIRMHASSLYTDGREQSSSDIPPEAITAALEAAEAAKLQRPSRGGGEPNPTATRQPTPAPKPEPRDEKAEAEALGLRRKFRDHINEVNDALKAAEKLEPGEGKDAAHQRARENLEAARELYDQNRGDFDKYWKVDAMYRDAVGRYKESTNSAFSAHIRVGETTDQTLAASPAPLEGAPHTEQKGDDTPLLSMAPGLDSSGVCLLEGIDELGESAEGTDKKRAEDTDEKRAENTDEKRATI